MQRKKGDESLLEGPTLVMFEPRKYDWSMQEVRLARNN